MCGKFKNLSVVELQNKVRGYRLCFNCLASFHSAESCGSRYICQKCRQKHNTLFHFDKPIYSVILNNPDKNNDNTATTSNQETAKHLALPVNVAGGHVFLATASVFVVDNHGKLRNCRVILDSGSQINFVSSKFVNLLQFPRKKEFLPVSGIGTNHVQLVSYISLKVKSCVKIFEVELICHVLPIVVNDLPCCSRPENGQEIPQELIPQLADPLFNSPENVDLLTGGGIFFDLNGSKRIKLRKVRSVYKTQSLVGQLRERLILPAFQI